jgi:hypothetical protein
MDIVRSKRHTVNIITNIISRGRSDSSRIKVKVANTQDIPEVIGFLNNR